MHPLIKQFIPTAVLLTASTAFGQNVITGTLDANSPTQRGLPGFLTPPERCTGIIIAGAVPNPYGTHTIFHTGGTLDVSLEHSTANYFSLGLHSDEADSNFPSCASALAYESSDSSAHMSLEVPAGTYTILATANGGADAKPYRVTYMSAQSATPVPTLGIFGLMGLAGAIGAAGVAMNRRRKQ